MEKEKLIQLVQGAQSGDRKAFSDLFNAFQSTVYGIAMRETKNPETAADVLQETFIEVIQTIGKLQEPVAFVSWLKTIAYHQCTRYYRKKEIKHETLVEEREDAPALFDALEEENEEFIPDKALENEELCETIRMFVEGLPDAQRAAIMMKYFDELSVKEIAAIQGVSENTVLSRLYYGRNAIKTEIETYEKKHDIKLHAIPLLPLLGNVFSNTTQGVSVKTSIAAAKAIATATGVKVSVAGAGVAGAVATMPLAAKIGAGAAALIITVATPVVVYDTISSEKRSAKSDTTKTTALSNANDTTMKYTESSATSTSALLGESTTMDGLVVTTQKEDETDLAETTTTSTNSRGASQSNTTSSASKTSKTKTTTTTKRTTEYEGDTFNDSPLYGEWDN